MAVKIVTGDNELVTRHVGEELGLAVGGVLYLVEVQGVKRRFYRGLARAPR